MFTKLQRFGLCGELYAAGLFRDLGFSVVLPADFNSPVDLYVDGVPVHVKSARRRLHCARPGVRRSRWYFRFTNIDFSFPSLVVCLLLPQYSELTHFDVFFIPSWAVASRSLSVTSNPSHYQGWASSFFGRVNSLYEVKAALPSCQLPLFELVG